MLTKPKKSFLKLTTTKNVRILKLLKGERRLSMIQERRFEHSRDMQERSNT